jgi:hypothetical protein
MKESTSIFIWLILVAVFASSISHMIEAWKKRDHQALSEGLGTMLFSGMVILIKALG